MELPEGRYLSCALQVPPDGSGQTRALLMRNRIFAAAGVRPDIVTLGPAPDHEDRIALLRERAMLPDGFVVRNLYEHYRERGWGDEAGTGQPLRDLSTYKVGEESRADGMPWRVTYVVPDERKPLYDYLREDGTPYLRIPAFGVTGGSSGRGTIWLVGNDGEVVEELGSAGQLWRRWIRELVAGEERSFVFTDSRFVAPQLARLSARLLHVIYVMHNLHVLPPYRWDSEVNIAYDRVLKRVAGFDALVNLTARQQEDIAQRCGRTSNMFVIPNPIDPPAAPPEEPVRDPRRVVILARLRPQKRLEDAIAAFAQVVREVPDARLDIYGDGDQRELLEEEIDRHGVGESVVLRGWDPRASEKLWSASAFLLTSTYEGYPLSTLEALARGCPVVAYDIKYGPREQITDGEDGFLVEGGDVDTLATRIVELLRDPELVARMSAAALRTAQHFGPDEFLAEWAKVLEAVVELRPRRTSLEEVELEVTRAGRWRLAGVLRARAKTRKGKLAAARVELDLVEDETARIASLPVRVEVADGELHFRARIKRPAEGQRLRLRLLWENSAWEADPLATR